MRWSDAAEKSMAEIGIFRRHSDLRVGYAPPSIGISIKPRPILRESRSQETMTMDSPEPEKVIPGPSVKTNLALPIVRNLI